ncbi:hypothetical protein F4819DRAFT_483678 [Hypoxylon fuscum]|nr:hypothetical protein F4819DRAFT_483678 [Hypoxylon fuscum]
MADHQVNWTVWVQPILTTLVAVATFVVALLSFRSPHLGRVATAAEDAVAATKEAADSTATAAEKAAEDNAAAIAAAANTIAAAIAASANTIAAAIAAAAANTVPSPSPSSPPPPSHPPPPPPPPPSPFPSVARSHSVGSPGYMAPTQASVRRARSN